jgi:hypothetical protein
LVERKWRRDYSILIQIAVAVMHVWKPAVHVKPPQLLTLVLETQAVPHK